jgi:lipopolysaccharide export system protein LptC
MSPRLSIALVALTLAALASWYVARQEGSEGVQAPAPAPADRGYYLEDARILGTASDGSLLYEIRAEFAEQLHDERIRFSAVRIEYSPASDVPWSIRADTALLSPDENRVLLEGNVRAVSNRGFSGQETEIRTDSLGFDPDRYIAETDDRIRLRIGGSSLTGTGMLASLKENRVQIRSNVSGRFVP